MLSNQNENFLMSNIQNLGLTGKSFMMIEKWNPIIYYSNKIKSIVTFILIMETLLVTKLEFEKKYISKINVIS